MAFVNPLTGWLDPASFPKLNLRENVTSSRQRNEVLAEDLFRRILCWERKRAERSGRCILLMLVNAERLLQAKHGKRTRREILSALSSCTRETDVVGWYQKGAVLGVTFTEFGETSWSALPDLILSKLSTSFQGKLTPEQIDQIQISFHFFPEDWSSSGNPQPPNEVLYPDLQERDKARRFSHLVKRLMDIAGSLVVLTACSPLLLLISAAIKLTSKGPVLFKQERIGRFGARFTFLKFRSMQSVNDSSIHRDYVRRFIAGEAELSPTGGSPNVVYKIKEDPRVTPLGRFLRKTSLDELPQFFNVLRGEMSLVGPRPPIPYEVEEYRVWHRCRVLEAKPGITGLWQVNGRSRLKFDDMVRLDLQYARTWSPWLDVKILLQTPRAVFFAEGAY